MIANAEQAVEALRHKRTGEVLPTKNIARNTKLVYYADELVGLKFHQTIIAMYTPNGVVIDTRDGFKDRGWFTMTTWDRIDCFTPANTHTNAGLRYIRSGTGTGKTMLYAHGTHVAANGDVTSRPMDPEIDARITAIVSNFPAKITRHAKKVVAAWRAWGETAECCLDTKNEDNEVLHSLGHVERNEYVIPPQLEALARSIRADHMWGDRLCDEVTRLFRKSLRETLVPAAVHAVAPNFPYPQLERRRA